MKNRLVALLAVGALSATGSVAVGFAATPGSAAGEASAHAGDEHAHGGDEHAHGGEGHRSRYRATLRHADGSRAGTVRFRETRDGTYVSVKLWAPDDLRAEGGSFHGFHVHANDDPANGTGCEADPAAPPSTWFVSADGHYSQPAADHGQHSGDMPVVYVEEDGRARATFVTDRFRPSDIVGRAVIVHVGPDNYGNIPLGDAGTAYQPVSDAALDLTSRTGNAGDRALCGVIGGD